MVEYKQKPRVKGKVSSAYLSAAISKEEQAASEFGAHFKAEVDAESTNEHTSLEHDVTYATQNEGNRILFMYEIADFCFFSNVSFLDHNACLVYLSDKRRLW